MLIPQRNTSKIILPTQVRSLLVIIIIGRLSRTRTRSKDFIGSLMSKIKVYLQVDPLIFDFVKVRQTLK